MLSVILFLVLLVVLILAFIPLCFLSFFLTRNEVGRVVMAGADPSSRKDLYSKGLLGAPFGGFGACTAENLLGKDVGIGELADSWLCSEDFKLLGLGDYAS